MYEIDLSFGKTKFFLRDESELTIFQNNSSEDSFANPNDSGAILYAALSRFIYDTTKHFPEPKEMHFLDDIEIPFQLKEIIKTPIPTVNEVLEKILANRLSGHYFLLAQSVYGEEHVYAKYENEFQIFRKTKKGKYQFLIHDEYQDQSKAQVISESLEPVVRIGKHEAEQVLDILYSFQTKGSPHPMFNSETLDALLDYAKREIDLI